MARILPLVLLVALCAGCASFQAGWQAGLAQQAQAQQATADLQGRVGRVIVTTADISQPYRILGPVNWPQDADSIRWAGPGLWGYGGYICEPQKVAAAAVNRYGDAADAVIGLIKSTPGGKQEHCDGTAVSFTK